MASFKRCNISHAKLWRSLVYCKAYHYHHTYSAIMHYYANGRPYRKRAKSENTASMQHNDTVMVGTNTSWSLCIGPIGKQQKMLPMHTASKGL